MLRPFHRPGAARARRGSRLASGLALSLCAALWLAPQAAPAQPAEERPAADQPTAPAEPADAAPHSFTASATPDRVQLGEPFTYLIEVTDEKAVRYELPKDLSLGAEFDLVEVKAERSNRGGETVTRFTIQALLFDLGDKKLPDIALRAIGPDGEKRLVVPGPPVLGLGQIPDGEEAELRDIMPPVEVPVARYTLLYAIGAALAVGTLAFLFLRWLQRRQPRRPLAPPAPPKPAHERALAALKELEREDLFGQGRGQEFFFRISEIVRDYLGERFGVGALDMTTEELLATLLRVPTPGLDFARLEAFVREGDLVKFAKAPVSAAGCKSALESATSFVVSTAPRGPSGGSSAQGAAA